MSRSMAGIIRVLALTGACVGVVLLWRADDYRDALGIRLVVAVVGTVVIYSLLDTIRTAGRAGEAGPFERVVAGPSRERAPVLRYDELRRLAELAGSASTVHVHLRPLVTDIATERFLADHRLSVSDPAAEALIPPRTWDLVRPDRRRPRDADAAGISAEELAAVLGELEAAPGQDRS